MRLSDFRLKTNVYPLVSSTDELIVVHREAFSLNAVVYVGCHEDATFTVQSAVDRTAVQTAIPWLTKTMSAGHRFRLDLPGDGDPTHQVSKITPSKGGIYVAIGSFGEFDAYFQQFTTNNA